MKILLIFVWVLIYAFFDLSLGYSSTTPVWTHLTYSFQHASFIHLVLNCVGFFFMMRALEIRYRPAVLIGVAYIISVGASFMVYYPKPVVGASGMVYALIGMFAWVVLTNLPRIVGKARQNNILFLITIAAALIISLLNPVSAGRIHLICMMAGAAYMCVLNLTAKNK